MTTAGVQSSIADQLAEVVLCVHSMVERLERDEEVQELAFFQAERDAIELEFEQRLAELRHALMEARPLLPAPAPATALVNLSSPQRHMRQTMPAALKQQPSQQAPHRHSNGVHASPQQVRAMSSTAPLPAAHQQYAASAAAVPAAPSRPTSAATASQQQSSATAVRSASGLASSHPVASHSAAATAADAFLLPPLPAGNGPLVLICGAGPEAAEVRVSAAELAACANPEVGGGAWLPTLQARAAHVVFACVRRTLERQAQTDSTQADAVSPYSFASFIPAAAMSSVLAAANTLAVPSVALWCMARLFDSQRQDLAALHGLVAESCLAPTKGLVSIKQLLTLQEAMLRPRTTSDSSEQAPFAQQEDENGPGHADSLRAVLNMCFFQRVSAAFPAYKVYLKRRTTLLAAAAADGASSPKSGAGASTASWCAWLEGEPPALGTPASILWCRIYCELHFARSVLHLARNPPPSSPQQQQTASGSAPSPASSSPASESAEALSLWRLAGFLPQCLHVDFGELNETAASADSVSGGISPASSSSAGASSPAAPALAAHFLQLLCRECPHVHALSLRRAGGEGLGAPQLLLLLATLPALTRLRLEAAKPPLDAASLPALRLAHYFPALQVASSDE